MLTSYYSQPDARLANQTVPLLDADTGRDLGAKVEFLGAEKYGANQDQTVQHVRLTGKGVAMDLWYDDAKRLVREEWVEQGHRTVVDLNRVPVKKNAASRAFSRDPEGVAQSDAPLRVAAKRAALHPAESLLPNSPEHAFLSRPKRPRDQRTGGRRASPPRRPFFKDDPDDQEGEPCRAAHSSARRSSN